MPDALQLAGTLTLTDVMADLAESRSIFHSEADFQFAFAQTAARLDPSVDLRLEVRQPGDAREAVDLVCRGQRITFVEFKYFTARWVGADPRTGEPFNLREHAATDLARLNFVHDVRRLERFIDGGAADDGVALMLTNVPSLWLSPRSRITNDHAFRVHDGSVLTGTRVWAADPQSRYTHHLRGRYTSEWRDYGPPLPGAKGAFRWLAYPIAHGE